MKDEFYIGWQAEAPDVFARRVRIAIFALVLIVPLVATGLVLHQRGFATSTFEYGKLTEVSGVMLTSPAPFIRVMRGNDVTGSPVYQYILLVAPGKHGAGEMLAAREAQLGHSLHGKNVSISGFLIYHDGRTLMEVETLEDILESGGSTVHIEKPEPHGRGALIGEITDPKCLFGVMKPGHGKPHRSCAARCIAGGIPPVLKTETAGGNSRYYILADAEGQLLNEEVIPFVGDPVVLCGRIARMGEWEFLYRDAGRSIERLSVDVGSEAAMCR